MNSKWVESMMIYISNKHKPSTAKAIDCTSQATKTFALLLVFPFLNATDNCRCTNRAGKGTP